MDKTEQAGQLRRMLQQCAGFEDDAYAQARIQADNYYFQRPLPGDDKLAPEGRSLYVSGDLSAMVEASLAQMAPTLKKGKICEFDPLGPEDEDQAQLESDAVQYLVMGTNNGFLATVSALKDALLHRNGILMPYAEDKTRRTHTTFNNVELEAVPGLTDDSDVVGYDYNADKKSLVVTREIETRQFKLKCVAMRNFVYYAEWSDLDLEGIPVCAVRQVSTRAELVKMGFSKSDVDACTEYRQDLDTESKAKKPRGYDKGAIKPYDESQQMVEWYQIYLMAESGDIDELRKVSFCYNSSVIFADEPCPFINLAAGTTVLNTHTFTGISLHDKLKQLQDSRTGMKRGLHDHINQIIKPGGVGLTGVVNEDDHASGRTNKLIGVDSTQVDDVRQAYMQIQQPDITANLLQNLESSARERTELGGAALDMQSAQTQIGDVRGSEGVDRIYSVGEALSGYMLDVAASTLIRNTFLIAHKVLREYFDKPIAFKRNGKWQYTTPTEWPEREAVTVQPGMSPGERQRQIDALTSILESQIMLSERGMEGILVDIDGYNRALLDRARLQEIPHPEQYFVDPQSPAAKARRQSNEAAAQRDEMLKANLMQVSLGMEQMREALDKYKHDTEMQFKYWAEALGVEVEEAKIIGQVTSDLAQQQAEGNERSRTESAGEGPAREPATADDS